MPNMTTGKPSVNSIGRYIPLAACLAVFCSLVLHFFSRWNMRFLATAR
jgi:hypothetical protein